jgi:hypothetical protein
MFTRGRNFEVEFIDYINDIYKRAVEPQELFLALDQTLFFQLHCSDLLTYLVVYVQEQLTPDATGIARVNRPVPSAKMLRFLSHIFESDTSIDRFLQLCFDSVLVKRVVHRANLCVRNGLQTRMWRHLLEASEASLVANRRAGGAAVGNSLSPSSGVPSDGSSSTLHDPFASRLERGLMVAAEIQPGGCDADLVCACIEAKALRVWKTLESYLLPVLSEICGQSSSSSYLQQQQRQGRKERFTTVDNVDKEFLRCACRCLDRTKVCMLL